MKIKGIVFLLFLAVGGTGCATGQTGQSSAMCLDGSPESFACERNLNRDRAFNGRNWF